MKALGINAKNENIAENMRIDFLSLNNITILNTKLNIVNEAIITVERNGPSTLNGLPKYDQ
ncbi:MAG: hypothetical protein K2O35_05080 [Clostridia bacterium]|nr:hypothetical protein [Clostridia bacterium]